MCWTFTTNAFADNNIEWTVIIVLRSRRHYQDQNYSLVFCNHPQHFGHALDPVSPSLMGHSTEASFTEQLVPFQPKLYRKKKSIEVTYLYP